MKKTFLLLILFPCLSRFLSGGRGRVGLLLLAPAFALFIFHAAQAQNLVPNFSFEQFDTCVNNVNQVYKATGWFGYNSPDYFNTCDTSGFVATPNNFLGYQYPATGNAYAGLITYYGSAFVREFIGIQLSSSLIIGQKYYVYFKVNLTVNEFPEACIATNKTGARFSKFSISPSVNNFAHIYTDSIITDTLNWVTISGSFISDSAYDYIFIGNFFDDSQTDTIVIKLDSVNLSDCRAYYYIDDVIVMEDTTNGIGENLFTDKIKIYPNPFNSSTTVIIKNIKENLPDISLYDLLGRKQNLLATISYFNNEIEIKIERDNLSNGIYLLKIQMDKKKFIHKLIIN